MLSYRVLLAASALYVTVGNCSNNPIVIPLPPKKSEPISNDLQSFSLEFAFFPDYAGNKSAPNQFSQNLLRNFKEITGVYPKVRVGGTSQYAFIRFDKQLARKFANAFLSQRQRYLLSRPKG